jgi:FixJ family two-component response regulator
VDPYDHVVLVVDDDRRIRDALTDLLSTYDLHVVTFGSAAEYNAYPAPDVPACLVLDVQLPDVNGLDLLDQTSERTHPQVVFITGHGDIPSSVRAIKAGAVDFLTKPLKTADAEDSGFDTSHPDRHRQGPHRCAGTSRTRPVA